MLEIRSKRPFKIWDSWRNVRKGLVVSNFEELVHRGKEKLGVPQNEIVSLVLESDGTQVEDGEYFKTLSNNTILLLLRHGERWCPTGVDIIRAAISAIPKIVCETIHALELHDETPSWKIMDNKGRVTVVLHWDQRSSTSTQVQPPKVSDSGQSAKYSPTKKVDLSSTQRPSLVIQTSLDKINYSNKAPTCPEVVGSGSRYSSPQITVINHDDMVQRSFVSPSNSSYGSANHHGRLVKQGTSSLDNASIHIHTAECSNHIHHPVTRNGSPVNVTDGPGQECDFHCCALHEEGRRIAVHKSVATSPIQDSQLHGPHQSSQTPSPQPTSSLSDGTRRHGVSKGHVRFRDTETEEESLPRAHSVHRIHQQHFEQHESSESETENTIIEDEVVTTEKFLLLIDQLTVDQKHHLSIKDIGIILERLSSKILDVERLDRENESDECYNWTIKALIRGDMLRELGVIYNGNYYAISEHPGYKEESEENNDDNDDEEEEEDRL
ncbi:DNA fragmentation factor-related protein 2 isoform X2 [Nasonia vitripennis]|uniref:CIDE-N domain-containing protein n=1 Tax=Nasonia vitripennis TaxID=7425 RepID=A0A7M6UCR5_NASVI|nr:DNA fragmentation factor-related protein 2 [Nasonia vitripennis]XP_031780960.1 DNA fragmentation factor-related protein 2 isoform X2 [Nasonia vitripennis]XP_032457403.1 DNA fragmentation factor-related protein 2 isoform X2 [Nasonia vitripennis]XP_032457404.1 DNA fragmentation factor-related protein 2 isoform X2 [Nasonia vitripennis]XP_032457405.1 DNA fragmentation factor-related protein 2 isoform X2 [Nasonia vitripennis]